MCGIFDFVKFRKDVGNFMDTHHNNSSMELGPFIYSLVNCLITFTTGVASLTWLVGHVIWYFILSHSHSGTLHTDLLLTGIAGGTVIISFISFGFGVMLVRGILRKRPALIKAHFIYGVIIVCICLVATIVLCTMARSFDVYVICALIIVGICVIYSAILGMIWMTYKKLRIEEQLYNHRIYIHHKLTTTL